MRLIEKIVVLFIAILMLHPYASAQNTEANVPDNAPVCSESKSRHLDISARTNIQKIDILYKNNCAEPRWDYAENQKALEILTQVILQLSSEQSNVRTIVIEGAASPVGSERYNNELSLRRATLLRNAISKMEGGAALHIHIISIGENWSEFKECVSSGYHSANREDVLAIIQDNSISNDEKERRLQALDNGKTWRVLVNKFMGSSRSVTAIRIIEADGILKSGSPFKSSDIVAPAILDMHFPELRGLTATPDILNQDSRNPLSEPRGGVVVAPNTLTSAPKVEATLPDSLSSASAICNSVSEQRKPIVAVRSNLLVPALNIGVEVPIGTHWSVGADYYFPWIWPKRDNKNCFELLAWGIEGRYWFGRNRTVFDRLQGHSVGVYGYMGYYDFERNYHGHQGEFMNVGVDYTYAMAVGKRKQIHFEFSLGVGYIYSQARKYTVIDAAGPLISDKITKKVGFFGPTKANVSLVVPIFQKVKPNDKDRR